MRFELFNVGEDSLREQRIKRIDEIYDSHGVSYEKVEQENKSFIAYFIKNIESFDNFQDTEESIIIELMNDSLTITTLTMFNQYLENYYYNMMIEKASRKEISYNYSTCFYMVNGKNNGIFSRDKISVLQFLLNKGLIYCKVSEKKYGPKEHMRRLAKKDFYISDNQGMFKRYISDEHKVIITTTRLTAMYIIKALLRGYKLISYSKGRNFVIEYVCNEELFRYIDKHKKEFEEIEKDFRDNFNEAQNMC